MVPISNLQEDRLEITLAYQTIGQSPYKVMNSTVDRTQNGVLDSK
jgi:hypothetical protein